MGLFTRLWNRVSIGVSSMNEHEFRIGDVIRIQGRDFEIFRYPSGNNSERIGLRLLPKKELTEDKMMFFTKMVDDLIVFAESDRELAEGIKYLDEQARQKGITFYEMVFQVLYKHDVDKRAKDWLQKKQETRVWNDCKRSQFCTRHNGHEGECSA